MHHSWIGIDYGNYYGSRFEKANVGNKGDLLRKQGLLSQAGVADASMGCYAGMGRCARMGLRMAIMAGWYGRRSGVGGLGLTYDDMGVFSFYTRVRL
ncbi:MAG: hypothetical protein LAT54_03520 [Cryomorphaceae bacterium]|nr:hypothetical protein [Cryomorphaceae bacterium]